MWGHLMMAAGNGTTGVTLSNDSIESVAMPLLLIVVLVLAGQHANSRRRGGGR